jgi:FkbM family methyltransferase
MELKNSLKKIIKKIPIRFTSNQRYDSQTKRIMQIVLEHNSTFIDVGSHKGEVLSKALKIAPKGKHYAFEPIPQIHKKLDKRYGQYCDVKNIGLSDHFGETSFNHVVSNPAYSGIKQRTYPKKEKIEEITIQVDTLDNQLFDQERIDMIKIDVEGGELDVLKGAVKILNKFHPVIVFEHGKGAAEYYETTPQEVFTFLDEQHYNVFTLKAFIENANQLTKDEFISLFNSNKEYYFLAKAKA